MKSSSHPSAATRTCFRLVRIMISFIAATIFMIHVISNNVEPLKHGSIELLIAWAGFWWLLKWPAAKLAQRNCPGPKI